MYECSAEHFRIESGTHVRMFCRTLSHRNSKIEIRQKNRGRGYLETWSGFEAANTAPWPSRGLHHFGKFLEPSMSELVEDAVASWCGDIVRHFWLIRNELQKFVELQLKYSYCIFLKGLCWVSVCWILNGALYSMSWVFSGFYFVPHCSINICHHMLCYLPNIYNYITLTASLERV